MSVDSADEEYDVSPHDRQYQKLLRVIGKPEKKRKAHHGKLADVQPEIQSTSIKPTDLIRSLKQSTSFGELKKQLNVSAKRNKVLPPPVHRQQKDRFQRAVAYDETKKNISIWDSVVNQNRAADQLTFPLNQLPFKLKTVEAAFNRFQIFKPKTPLEIETAKLLQGSKYNLSNKVELTAAEEETLKAMSLAEANERRAELQKMRALISYREQKFRRQKQIKSKKFHRLEKRRKRKELIKEFEELKAKDPEAAAAKLQLIEMDRIEERVTLKHRNTGKWAKQIQMHAKRDPKTKEALQEQLRISRELLEKKTLGDDDEMQPNEEEMIIDEDNTADVTMDSENPWMKANSMREESKKAFEKSTVTLSELQKIKQKQNKTPTDADAEEEKESQKPKPSGLDVIDEIFEELDSETESFKHEKIEENRRQKRKLKSKANVDVDVIAEMPKVTQSQQAAKEKSESKANAVDVDPNSYLTATSRLISTINPAIAEHLDEEVETEGVSDLIAEAFADDDLVEQFEEEKRRVENREQEEEMSPALPGWGSWTGPDVKGDRRKNKRFPTISDPPKTVEIKKPRFMPGVIMSEITDESIRKFQVNDVPFPFTSVDDFESSIRHPLGREWNPETSHKVLVEPKVVTKIGTIIAPIDKELTFKNQNKRKRKQRKAKDNDSD